MKKRPFSDSVTARPRWRLHLGRRIALGPGKADLLEAIEAEGSISGAARRLGMSYRRAWQLVQEMNGCFARPLVATSNWRGGGAALTPTGTVALRLYRSLEKSSLEAGAGPLRHLEKLIRPGLSKRRP